MILSCDSGRDGSGVVGFKAELTGGTSSAGPFTALSMLGPEVIPALTNLAVPQAINLGTSTKIFLKVSATSEDTTNLGTAYNCTMYFQ